MQNDGRGGAARRRHARALRAATSSTRARGRRASATSSAATSAPAARRPLSSRRRARKAGVRDGVSVRNEASAPQRSATASAREGAAADARVAREVVRARATSSPASARTSAPDSRARRALRADDRLRARWRRRSAARASATQSRVHAAQVAFKNQALVMMMRQQIDAVNERRDVRCQSRSSAPNGGCNASDGQCPRGSTRRWERERGDGVTDGVGGASPRRITRAFTVGSR